MYDVIIIGSGPAGISAGLQTAKNNLSSLIISKEPVKIEEKNVLLLKQVKAEVVSLEKNIVSFTVETKQGLLEYAKSVIIATGEDKGDGNTGFDLITAKNSRGMIKIDCDMKTSITGIFAAGDCTIAGTNGKDAAGLQGELAGLGAVNLIKKNN